MNDYFVFNRLILSGIVCCGIFLSGCAAKSGEGNALLKSPNTALNNADTGFANHYWKLIKLNGKAIELGKKTETEVHLITGNNDNRMHGFSGCNRFTGNYTLKEDHLEFGQVAATRMACMDDDNTETAFLQALASVKRFVIRADVLTLFDGQNRAILEFEAVYLR